MSSVHVRAAVPTEEEGRIYATFLNTASDGLMKTLLGKRYDQIIAQAYQSPGHDLSFERAVLAESGGHIVGMASALTAAEHASDDTAPLVKAAGLRVFRMAAVSLLMRPLFSFMARVPEGDYYLQALAVDDDHRGIGIGSELLDHVERSALSAGCRRVALDVEIHNEAARRLYERRGFTIDAQSPRARLTTRTGLYRMVKALTVERSMDGPKC